MRYRAFGRAALYETRICILAHGWEWRNIGIFHCMHIAMERNRKVEHDLPSSLAICVRSSLKDNTKCRDFRIRTMMTRGGSNDTTDNSINLYY
jgi:hypothetical protein